MATQVISLYGTVTLVDNMSGPLNRVMHNTNSWKMGMMAAFAAVGVAVAGLGVASVKAATNFESAFTGVRKTVNATEEEFQALRQGILDMAKDATNPVAGLPKAQLALAGIMEQAGQLGIRGVDNLLKFTEVVAKLGLATNLGSDAAIKLAQFLNITGDETSTIDRLGSTIVALGNNLATTENDVMQMAMRIAGAGTVAGLTSQEILALAGAASSLGLRAEMGGSAISMIFNQMAEAIGKGGDQLQAFSKLAGMSTTAFDKLFKDEPVKAFQAVVQGLSKLDATKQAEALDNIGLSGIRVSDALRRLSSDVGGLQEAIDLANQSYEENNALNVEAERRLKTTAAQWNVLKNTLYDILITIGDRLLPVINTIMSTVQQFLVSDGFTAFLDRVLDKGGAVATAIGNIATQIGGNLSSVLDRFSGSAGGIMDFLFGNMSGQGTSNLFNLPDVMGPGALAGLDDIFDLSNPNLGNMFDLPSVAGPGERQGLPPIFGDMGGEQQGLIPMMLEKLKDLKDNVLPVIVEHFNTLRNETIPAIVDFIQPRLIDAFNTLKNDIIPLMLEHFNTFKDETLPKIVEFIKPKLMDAFTEAKNVWEDIKEGFVFVRGEVLPVIVDIFENRLQPAFMDALTLWDTVRGSFETARDFIRDNLLPVVDDIVGAFETLKDETLPPITQKLKEDWKPIFDDIKDIAERWIVIFRDEILPVIRDEIWPTFRDYWGKIAEEFMPLFRDYWGKIAEELMPLAVIGIGILYETILWIAGKLVEWIGSVTTIVEKFIELNQKTGFLAFSWNLFKTGMDAFVGVLEGISDALTTIKDTLSNISFPSLPSWVPLVGGGSGGTTSYPNHGTSSSGSRFPSRSTGVTYTGGGGTTGWRSGGSSGGGGTRTFRLGDTPGHYGAGEPLVVSPKASPELFIPSTGGYKIPNADMGNTFNIMINANTYEGGQAAARGFLDYAAQRGLNVTGLTG